MCGSVRIGVIVTAPLEESEILLVMKMLDRKKVSGTDSKDTPNLGQKLNRFLRRNADGFDTADDRNREKSVVTKDSGLSLKDRFLKDRFLRDRFPKDRFLKKEKGSEAGEPPGSSHSRPNRSVKERRERRVSWIFLSPSLVGVCLFFVLPFIVVIYYSMIDNPIRHRFVGFANYFRVFRNEAFRVAVANTLKFSIVAVPLAVGLSLLLAVVMEQRLPWKSRFRSFFLSPMMVPTASVIMIWQILFHYNGLVNVFLLNITGGKIDWLKSSYAQVPIILLFLWKNLGYNMILFMSGLANIPKDQIEVARLESASEFQIFWLIKVRYLSSTIMFVTIMSLINSFKVFREIYLMAGDYPYDALYMLQHFMNNTFKSLDYQKLSAAAVLMAIFMVIVIGALFLTEDWFGRDLE